MYPDDVTADQIVEYLEEGIDYHKEHGNPGAEQCWRGMHQFLTGHILPEIVRREEVHAHVERD